jgi:hypothetical protein
MTDIEAPGGQHSPQQPNQPQPQASFQLGFLTLCNMGLSICFFVFRLSPHLKFLPNQHSFFSFLFAPLFPFAVQLKGFMVNLVILVFFSTFFERRYGTLGFLLKLEFFKILFVILAMAVYRFFYFIFPSSTLSSMLSLGDFSLLFMILISQEAFERPNDFSIIPIVNIPFKNVHHITI